ncbi:MAG: site-specific DNA-methyltransferase [Caldisphaeraceae archaeon]|nr:site-specific DNA-methyltransferase [Caldisphaeraceae archaeon]
MDKEDNEFLETKNSIYDKPKRKSVAFKDIIVEIPSKSYATYGMYYYPARFIPHVIRFVLKNYTRSEEWVFDPFAGSGTVAIESHLMGRNYILWDLNPLLNVVAKAATYLDPISLKEIMVDMDYKKKYIPNWENIYYWHPQKFIRILSKVWGYYHNEVPDKLKPLVAIPLLKVTRKFSYADKGIAKLYKSRRAISDINYLLSIHWRKLFFNIYRREVETVYKKIMDFHKLNPRIVKGDIKFGIDSITTKLDRNVDILFTSPPYLQAQEYIRSSKLELFWLGYNEDYINKLQKKEIPYREPLNIKVQSDTYLKFKEIIEALNHHHLNQIFETYFKSLAYFFNNNQKYIKKYMIIFVGHAKIRTFRIPIDIILKEHLEYLGWRHKETLVDKIKTRKLFKATINPATGLSAERTPAEYLLVMEK